MKTNTGCKCTRLQALYGGIPAILWPSTGLRYSIISELQEQASSGPAASAKNASLTLKFHHLAVLKKEPTEQSFVKFKVSEQPSQQLQYMMPSTVFSAQMRIWRGPASSDDVFGMHASR